jgi:hypothetical protein
MSPRKKTNRGRPPLGHAAATIAVPAPTLAAWRRAARLAGRPLGLWIMEQIETHKASR